MKKINKTLIIIFLACFLLSCSNKHKAQFKTLSGYISWQQNDWNKSISSFYSALNLSKDIQDKENIEYSNYNIASTYLMQNEDDSAYFKLNKINKTKNKHLRSSVFYQKGIIAFKNKDYEKATQFFKKSIEYDSNSIDAKINYELSKKYLSSKKTKKQQNKVKGLNTKNKEISDSTIMNLIRKKEKEKCSKSKEKKDSLTNDY